MNTSTDSGIIIENINETSCESTSCNCKEMMAAISKRQREEIQVVPGGHGTQ